MRAPWALAPGIALLGLAAATRKWSSALVIGLAAVGMVSGLFLASRTEQAREIDLPVAEVEVLVEVLSDGEGTPANGWVRARILALAESGGVRAWYGPAGWLRGSVSEWRRTTRWWVRTVMEPIGYPSGRVDRSGGPTWSGPVLSARPAGVAGGWLGGRIAAVRSLVIERLKPDQGPGRALLAGFLLGDTSHLSETDGETMRRAGLSHFVAVSGSNVALFLGALFVVAGPLGWTSRRRATLGIAGLAFFVVLIGPDPSVLRAAVMAGLVLLARPLGLRPDVWTVISVGVGLLLLAAPELAFSLAFQLSVAATIGVLAGTGWFGRLRPEWLRVSLGASCGAQLAVAPILLMSFGSVPLWSPLANLAAAPLVVAATGLGAAGAVVGFDLLVAAAAVFARAVMGIAHLAAPLPQIGWPVFAFLVAMVLAGTRQRLRPAALIVSAGLTVVVTLLVTPDLLGESVSRPAFVALDVGQGDALLLLGEKGETVLIDGGASGLRIRDGLARFGIGAIDLLVVSHAHHDHYGGLEEVVGAVPIGAMWYAPFPGQSPAFRSFVEDASGVTDVRTPGSGTYRVGSIGLEVLGPARRFASLNDQSIILVATLGGMRVLLSGDIERVAQRELEPPRVDILKVPHQGGATSDPAWLIATGASRAVVSVGPNRFGHPSVELLEQLETAGMEVRRTDLEGDIVIRPARRVADNQPNRVR